MFEARPCPAARRAASAVTAALLSGSLALAGCSPAAPPAPARNAAQLEALRPADTRLADLYERACFLCHARVGSGAPLVGDAAAWAPRLAKGTPALVSQVKAGLGGMPARGLCPDCSDADFGALIAFMSQPEGPQ
jgi:cytochrome c5